MKEVLLKLCCWNNNYREVRGDFWGHESLRAAPLLLSMSCCGFHPSCPSAGSDTGRAGDSQVSVQKLSWGASLWGEQPEGSPWVLSPSGR